jgi:hypothetical protein
MSINSIAMEEGPRGDLKTTEMVNSIAMEEGSTEDLKTEMVNSIAMEEGPTEDLKPEMDVSCCLLAQVPTIKCTQSSEMHVRKTSSVLFSAE